jgi:hypothetical protein
MPYPCLRSLSLQFLNAFGGVGAKRRRPGVARRARPIWRQIVLNLRHMKRVPCKIESLKIANSPQQQAKWNFSRQFGGERITSWVRSRVARGRSKSYCVIAALSPHPENLTEKAASNFRLF